MKNISKHSSIATIVTLGKSLTDPEKIIDHLEKSGYVIVHKNDNSISFSRKKSSKFEEFREEINHLVENLRSDLRNASLIGYVGKEATLFSRNLFS